MTNLVNADPTKAILLCFRCPSRLVGFALAGVGLDSPYQNRRENVKSGSEEMGSSNWISTMDRSTCIRLHNPVRKGSASNLAFLVPAASSAATGEIAEFAALTIPE